MSKISVFYSGLAQEWRSISWIDRKRSLVMLLLVLICVLLSAAFFSFVDFIFLKLVSFLVK